MSEVINEAARRSIREFQDVDEAEVVGSLA